MSGFKLQRIGMLMEPEPGNPNEVEGVLNPAAARGPDGALYLFPRLVAKGNYSRIGIARVKFNEAGDPAGVERLGIALEPEADYERRPDGSGGCEDPRVTYVEPLHRYVMSYTAFSPVGPRIALALSEDLFHWTRLGLATYAHWHGVDLSTVDDKDASLFPVAIPNSSGHRELGMLHRPLFPGTRPEETSCQGEAREVDLDHESIWISYCPPVLEEPDRLGRFTSHHRRFGSASIRPLSLADTIDFHPVRRRLMAGEILCDFQNGELLAVLAHFDLVAHCTGTSGFDLAAIHRCGRDVPVGVPDDAPRQNQDGRRRCPGGARLLQQ